MKQLFFSLLIVTTFSFFLTNSALSIDNPQDISKSDYNIVLITIDTLRADHLSCYGYERKTTPTIDKIAEKGILFKNAIAPSSWTAPSMVSLFTSVYPANHGVVNGFVSNKQIFDQEVFADKLTTLTEILKAHEYTTFGVSSNLHLSEQCGFARGFDYFKCLSFSPAPFINKTAYSWENDIKNSDKFFLWIHYFDPHHFYYPRKPWIEQYTSHTLTKELYFSKKTIQDFKTLIPLFKEDPQTLSDVVALYDSEINYVDSYLGELIKKLELDKNTLMIITSDHGEEFLEHGKLDHGSHLYSELINIPLIIKLPQSKGKKVIDKQVSLIDIMPTILSLLNIPQPEQTLGNSLITPDGEVKNIADRLLFAELERDNKDIKAVLTKDWKYIYNYKEKKTELTNRLKKAWNENWRYLFNYKEVIEGLYNRKQDPSEHTNLINEIPSVGTQLKDRLNQWVTTTPRYPAKKIKIIPSQDMRDKLEALGYLAGEGKEEGPPPTPKGCNAEESNAMNN
jgi:arylsulfatase A-like enzyme